MRINHKPVDPYWLWTRMLETDRSLANEYYLKADHDPAHADEHLRNARTYEIRVTEDLRVLANLGRPTWK